MRLRLGFAEIRAFRHGLASAASLGTVCRHPRHRSFAGTRDAEGFISSRTAEYPEALAQAFAALIKPLLPPCPGVAVEWDCVLLEDSTTLPYRCEAAISPGEDCLYIGRGDDVHARSPLAKPLPSAGK